MALDSSQFPDTTSESTLAAPRPLAAGRPLPVSSSWIAKAASTFSGVIEGISQTRLARWFSANLFRRILLANLLGLSSLLGSMLYLSLHHGWLLDAKIDVLKTVSRITAEAIAYRAVNDRAVFDANKLPEKAFPRVQRDDAFAALELPVDPQQTALVLKKLVDPAKVKARVYSRKGSLIIDSDTLFSNAPVDATPLQHNYDGTPRLRNFWTKFHYWVINKELKVYRELGTANGFLYPEVQRALEDGIETPILLLNEKGQQIVSMAEPVKRGTKVLGVLLVSTQPGDIDDVLWDERWLILQIAGLALLVSFASSLMLYRTVADPVAKLSEAANHVSANISARQELPDYPDRSDEVGQLSRAFADMTAALFRRIQASEKFAADVAHELKNPLAAARSTAESLAYVKTDQDRNELIGEIQNELKRLNRLINDVSNASRLDAELARQELTPVNLKAVLDGVVSIFSDMLSGDTRKIQLICEHLPQGRSFTVPGNDGRLTQVFTNLVDNALSFSPDGGTVLIKAKLAGPWVEVSVEDEGPGIPEAKLAAIFERFYSDRPQTDGSRGKNSGLGLSISREIIKSHKGEIFAENRFAGNREARSGHTEPAGARLIVRLPQAFESGGGGGRWS